MSKVIGLEGGCGGGAYICTVGGSGYVSSFLEREQNWVYRRHLLAAITSLMWFR